MYSNLRPTITVSQLNSILRRNQAGTDTEHLYRNVRPPSVYHPEIYEADNNLYAEVQEVHEVHNTRVPEIISKSSIIAIIIFFKITAHFWDRFEVSSCFEVGLNTGICIKWLILTRSIILQLHF